MFIHLVPGNVFAFAGVCSPLLFLSGSVSTAMAALPMSRRMPLRPTPVRRPPHLLTAIARTGVPFLGRLLFAGAWARRVASLGPLSVTAAMSEGR